MAIRLTETLKGFIKENNSTVFSSKKVAKFTILNTAYLMKKTGRKETNIAMNETGITTKPK